MVAAEVPRRAFIALASLAVIVAWCDSSSAYGAGAAGCSNEATTDTGAPSSPASQDWTIDGRYQWEIRPEDANEVPGIEPEHAIWTVELDDGWWWIVEQYVWDHPRLPQPEGGFRDSGPYSVFEDHIVFCSEWHDVTLEFTYSMDEVGDIMVTPAGPMNTFDEFFWSYHEWRRLDAAATTTLDGS